MKNLSDRFINWKGGGGGGPPPPDPYAVADAEAGAQTRLIRESARLQDYYGRYNTAGPFGAEQFSRNSAGRLVRRYRPTADIREYFGQESRQRNALGGFAADMAPSLGRLASSGFDPELANFRDISTEGLQPWQVITTARLPDWRDVSPGEGGFEDSRRRVEDALLSRQEPLFQRQRADLEARLAEQGIAPGSEGYANRFDEFNRSQNDARMQAILAGGQEQSRLFDLTLQEAAQQNQLRQAELGERIQEAGFGNQLRQAQFGELESEAAQQNQLRQQMLAEALTRRALPFQEYAQILQMIPGVRMPGGAQQPGFNIPAANYNLSQGVWNAYNTQLQQYQQQQAQQAGGLGSILGLLGTAAGAFFGGPAGAALGAAVGTGIGGAAS